MQFTYSLFLAATITLTILPGYPGAYIFALNVAGVHANEVFPVTVDSDGMYAAPIYQLMPIY